MSRLISNEEFNKYFPDGELGQECYREISKYVIKYLPEIDGDNHTECDDNIILYVKDHSEPISPKIINSFLNHFRDELQYLTVLRPVSFCDIPLKYGVSEIEIEDIVLNHEPVYQIIFELFNLKYFDYFFTQIELDN